MHVLTPGNQTRQLEALHHDLYNLFSRPPAQWPEDPEKSPAVADWAPLVDISEDDRECLLKFKLPETKREDVKVTTGKVIPAITGDRPCNCSLPDDPRPAKVSAEFKDGVLMVHLAKKEKSQPPPEQVVDEITAWWQKTLGQKAVLGQASNIPTLGQRAPLRKLVWTKPEKGSIQQQNMVAEPTPGAIEKTGANNPGIHVRKGQWELDGNLTTFEELKNWSGVKMNEAVIFLVIGLMRSAGAAILIIRAALQKFRPTFGRV